MDAMIPKIISNEKSFLDCINNKIFQRFMIVALYFLGFNFCEISRKLKISRQTCMKWVTRFLCEYHNNFNDFKRSGRPKKLNSEQEEIFKLEIMKRKNHTEYEEFLSCRIVANISISLFKISISVTSSFRYLKKLNYPIKPFVHNPLQTDHRFQSNPTADSNKKRPLIIQFHAYFLLNLMEPQKRRKDAKKKDFYEEN